MTERLHFFSLLCIGEGNGNPLQRSCLVKSHGCRLWGCTESDTTEVTQQQQLIFTIELILLTLNPSLAQPFSPPVSLVTWVTPDVRV